LRFELCGTQMSTPFLTRKVIGLKTAASPRRADVEFRVIWNKFSGDWEIYRNGVKTNGSRRKKQSAIDIAILKLRSEDRPLEAKAIVTSLKDEDLKIEWESPSISKSCP
jgi:hypothetical protein